jgi:hypothetical protein
MIKKQDYEEKRTNYCPHNPFKSANRGSKTLTFPGRSQGFLYEECNRISQRLN